MNATDSKQQQQQSSPSPSPSPSSSTSTINQIKQTAIHTVDKVLNLTTLPSTSPVSKIGLHLCALHAYHYDIKRQVIAHHYCSHVNDEIHQCGKIYSNVYSISHD
jgi:hypothetical protein